MHIYTHTQTHACTYLCMLVCTHRMAFGYNRNKVKKISNLNKLYCQIKNEMIQLNINPIPNMKTSIKLYFKKQSPKKTLVVTSKYRQGFFGSKTNCLFLLHVLFLLESQSSLKEWQLGCSSQFNISCSIILHIQDNIYKFTNLEQWHQNSMLENLRPGGGRTSEPKAFSLTEFTLHGRMQYGCCYEVIRKSHMRTQLLLSSSVFLSLYFHHEVFYKCPGRIILGGALPRA